MRSLITFSLLLLCVLSSNSLASEKDVFDGIQFQSNDSILVTKISSNGEDQVLFSWQADKLLVPASLTKLATAYAAISKWGLDYRFSTDFYRVGNALWVKGYGDPFLVSEELDLLVTSLPPSLVKGITSIKVDNSYFNVNKAPGRTTVSDPYNAPLSAVSANFNTVNIGKAGGKLKSMDPQTPLTPTAHKVSNTMTKDKERVNLVNANNAQQNFAELLAIKLAKPTLEIHINQSLDGCFELGYRHQNSRTLADVLRGTLEFSNNFMANQVFLKLGDNTADQMSFMHSEKLIKNRLSQSFNVQGKQTDWQGHNIVEGAGLSRDNRLSANQIDDLLMSLSAHKNLFKGISNKHNATVRAKTGTLNGVRSYAGYIERADGKSNDEYRFVFNFNRSVPYRYRDEMLKRLLQDLHD